MLLERRAFKSNTPNRVVAGDTDLIDDNVKKEFFSAKMEKNWETFIYIEKSYDENLEFEMIEIKIGVAEPIKVGQKSLAEIYASESALADTEKTKFSFKQQELCGESASFTIKFDNEYTTIQTGVRGGCFGEVFSHYKKSVIDKKKVVFGHAIMLVVPIDLYSMDDIEKEIMSLSIIEKVEEKNFKVS